MIPGPYLLYLGSANEPLSAKTARGIAVWRPGAAIGEIAEPGCTVSVGLPRMTIADSVAGGARTLVLGFANAGGTMDAVTVARVLEAIGAGLNVASGLHARLCDVPEIAAAAARAKVQLIDVRTPPPLPVGTGDRRAGRRLLTVGTDCAVGKMYTTLALEKEMRARGIAADFRATGQTGIMIAGSGVPIDAVVSDFLSGAAEWLTPARDDDGWDLIEGQGSLFHPSFAGVSLGLLHGSQPDALVLCHEAGRETIRHTEIYPVPDLALCLERNLEAGRLTSPNVRAVGVAVNTSRLQGDAAQAYCLAVEDRLGLPCQDPVAMGTDRIVDNLIACFAPSVPA
ncbi:N-acetyltransferase DgcN [Sphingomonas sp.]|uniref:N-acetyltransferase DgcN n=1 Tax=Sphingomonas sp. TaxID=28214 RepID=UPI002DD61E44|nr:N-acetyltransferase DgcN [Sphingomonas sp.]